MNRPTIYLLLANLRWLGSNQLFVLLFRELQIQANPLLKVYPAAMRVIVNFVFNKAFAIHCIVEDARTVVSGWTHVADKGMLVIFVPAVTISEYEY
jgi:hypothetical protein